MLDNSEKMNNWNNNSHNKKRYSVAIMNNLLLIVDFGKDTLKLMPTGPKAPNAKKIKKDQYNTSCRFFHFPDFLFFRGEQPFFTIIQDILLI